MKYKTTKQNIVVVVASGPDKFADLETAKTIFKDAGLTVPKVVNFEFEPEKPLTIVCDNNKQIKLNYHAQGFGAVLFGFTNSLPDVMGIAKQISPFGVGFAFILDDKEGGLVVNE